MAAAGDALQLRLADVKAEIGALQQRLAEEKAKVQNGGLSSVEGLPKKALGPVLKRRKVLTGHVSRVYAVDWACDSTHVLSARCVARRGWEGEPRRVPVSHVVSSMHLLPQPRRKDDHLERHDVPQDARCVHAPHLLRSTAGTPPACPLAAVISLRSTWVMTCSYEHKTSSLVACGGLDNVCTVYNTGGVGAAPGSTARVAVSGGGGCAVSDSRQQPVSSRARLHPPPSPPHPPAARRPNCTAMTATSRRRASSRGRTC